jgi:hypothetical protein
MFTNLFRGEFGIAALQTIWAFEKVRPIEK